MRVRNDLQDVARTFTPRPYQIELYERAKKRNVIIVLGTNAGKTNIAVMLINHMRGDIIGDWKPEGPLPKRTIFLAPHRPLAAQQAEVIRREVDDKALKVGLFTGEEIKTSAGFDNWSVQFWHKIFQEHQILVMTPEVFRQVLTHGLFSMSRVNLLIFDECHHARKDHPMNEIMRTFYHEREELERPRILGMTASLVTENTKRKPLSLLIKELEANLGARVEAIGESRELNRYATNPDEYLKIYSTTSSLNADFKQQIDTFVKEFVREANNFLNVFLKPLKEKLKKTIDYSFGKTTVKCALKAVKLAVDALNEHGLWAFMEACTILITELRERATIEPTRSHVLIAGATILEYGLGICQKLTANHENILETLVSPKMLLLLEELKMWHALRNAGGDGTREKRQCGIIFVDTRLSAQILSIWLRQLSYRKEYDFIKVDFVVGSSRPLSSDFIVKRQENALAKFRKHELNLLVATSVLEEGLDVPRCNLVIRYKFPLNVREYIQSKGRARADGGKFILMAPSEDQTDHKETWLQFQQDEEEMKNYVSDINDENSDSDEIPPDIFAKYLYETPANAKLHLNSSIAIVNRYCSKLPSDSFTTLVPKTDIEEVTRNEISIGFVCNLRLPISCPLRETIKSDVMPRKKIAKKVAAFMAVKRLHSIKELDDNLLPPGKDSLKSVLDACGIIECPAAKAQGAGTTKRRQYYNKMTADILKGPIPKPDKQCFLNIFAMRLTCPIPEEQNTRGRTITDPASYPRCLAIISSVSIPPICDFPVFTRSGEVFVSIEPVKKQVMFTEQELDAIQFFHKFTFHKVLHLDRYPMQFDFDQSGTNYLLVPVTFNKVWSEGGWVNNSNLPDAEVDWPFIEKVRQFDVKGEHIPSEEERKNFVYLREMFEDAVVRPWYRTGKSQLYYYVAEIMDNQNPKSPFPDDVYPSFEEYYKQKYNLQIFNMNQHLLDVDNTSARLNLLTPRFVNRKGKTLPMSTAKTKKEKRENPQQILTPELVIVHPFPASFWMKVVTLPCILYRLNHLLLSEQLRKWILTEINFDFRVVTEKWSPLYFGWTLTEALALKENDDDQEGVPDLQSPRKKQRLSTDETSSTDFVIDNFDPEKHCAELDDSEFDQDEVMAVDQMLGFGGGGPLPQGPFAIGGPIGVWDRKPKVPTKPKIIELPDDDGVPLSEPQERPRAGSPSCFETSNITWDDCEDDFIDTGLAQGVSKILLPGNVINREGLCQDLATSKDLSDEDDESDGSINGLDEDTEFAMEVDLPPNRVISPISDTLRSRDRKEPVTVNEIIALGLLSDTPVIEGDEEEFEEENGIVAGDESLDEISRRIKEAIAADLEEYRKDIRKTIFEDESMNSSDDQEGQPDTSFGELLPKHKRDEMKQTLDGLSIKFDTLKDDPIPIGPSPAAILQACTMSNASDGINLERLETVGDSFLKFAVTLFFYVRCPEMHEGKLSFLRSRQISNFYLYHLGRKKGLGNFIVASKFEPNDNWLPPGFFVPEGLDEALANLTCSDKEMHFDVSQLKELNLENLSPEKLKDEIVKRKDLILSSGGNHPSTFSEVDEYRQIPYNLLTQQSIPDKSIADVVEALIGAFLINSGTRGALHFMQWLGLKVMFDEEDEKFDPDINSNPNDNIWHHLPQPPSPLWNPLPQDDPRYLELKEIQDKQMHVLYNEAQMNIFEEECLHYTFKDKSLLVQAFTHNSFYENEITDCYQRLEFLGDAILDFLITRLLYEDPRKHSPGTLTDLRSALVNNPFFASLAVEYKFDKYLKVLSHDLMKVKANFVKKIETTNKNSYRDRISLCIGEEESGNLADVEVPKALGDVFESVAGAIYLDSGMSLDAVWKVYYRMMMPEIEHFSKNVPKSPIRELQEMYPKEVQFVKPEPLSGKQFRVCVEYVDDKGRKVWEGLGRNKRIAKYTAAKKALRDLRPAHKRPL